MTLIEGLLQSFVWPTEYDTWTPVCVCECYNKHLNDEGSYFRLYFSLLTLVAHCVRGSPGREGSGGEGLHYSAARVCVAAPYL